MSRSSSVFIPSRFAAGASKILRTLIAASLAPCTAPTSLAKETLMNPLRRLATAALVALILVTLAVPNCHGATVTIGLAGRMLSSYPAGGWQYDDPFLATYSFNDAITGSESSDLGGPNKWYYDPTATGTFNFGPTTYTTKGMSVYVSNNAFGSHDRYITTFYSSSMPTGLAVNFIQTDFTDWTMASLSDNSLVTQASILDAFGSKGGRVDWVDNYDQPRFSVTSVTAVPEPSTGIIALAGLACGGYSMWRQRKRA